MTHNQENEMHSCINYLRPLFDRIRKLGGDASYTKDFCSNTSIASSSTMLPPLLDDSDDDSCSYHYESKKRPTDDYLTKTISLTGLRKVLKYFKKIGQRQDVNEYDELINTDKQFIMALEQLYTLNSSCNDKYFTFLEVMHCYKTIVNGMMLMEQVNDISRSQSKGESSSGCVISQEEHELIQESRSLLRDRTLDMLSVFSDDKVVEEKETVDNKDDMEKSETGTYVHDATSEAQEDPKSVVITESEPVPDVKQEDSSSNDIKAKTDKTNKVHFGFFLLSGLLVTILNLYISYKSKTPMATKTLSIPQLSLKLYGSDDDIKGGAQKL